MDDDDRLPDALTCPYCGEPAEVDLDPGSAAAGETLELIQACEVCCRPWRVLVAYDDAGAPAVTLLREDD